MAPQPDALVFLKLLLDPRRLAVAGLVAARPRGVAELAAETGQPARAVLATLGSLVQAGLVSRHGAVYRLERAALRSLAGALPQRMPADREVFCGMTGEEQEVLARFFRGRTLVEVPAQHAKRRIVLERLALDFEPGRRYGEREVNDLLARRHADYAALRRYLVDAGLLDRGGGKYWRAGGRVET